MARFEIWISENGWSNLSLFTLVDTIECNGSCEYTLIGLNPDTRYWTMIREVQGTSDEIKGAFSTPIELRTLYVPPNGFKILLSEDDVTYTEVETVYDDFDYTLTGLEEGTTYYSKIEIVGFSEFTNTISFTTESIPFEKVEPKTIPNIRTINLKVEISKDGVLFEDVTRFVLDVQINYGNVNMVGTQSAGIDSGVSTATLILFNEKGFEFNKDMISSPMKNFVNDMNKIKIWTNITNQYQKWIYSLEGITSKTFDLPHENILNNQENTLLNFKIVKSGYTYTVDNYPEFFFNTDNSQYYIYEETTKPNIESLDTVTGTVVLDRFLEENEIVLVEYYYNLEDTGNILLFEGIIGDGYSVNDKGTETTLQARDKTKYMDIAFITNEVIYGNTNGAVLIENVIESLITDNEIDDVIDFDDTTGSVNVPESTNFAINPYIPIKKSVLEATQELVNQIGWFLGYRFGNTLNTRELILYKPPIENETALYSFEDDEFLTSNISSNDADVRNYVEIIYQDVNGDVKKYAKQNNNSINKYRKRPMILGLNTTTNIDTEEEAEILAESALNQLKEPNNTANFVFPFLPQAQLFDMFRYIDRKKMSDYALASIISLQHSLTFRNNNFQARTKVIANKERVINKYKKFLQLQDAKGSNPTPYDSNDEVVLNKTLRIRTQEDFEKWVNKQIVQYYDVIEFYPKSDLTSYTLNMNNPSLLTGSSYIYINQDSIKIKSFGDVKIELTNNITTVPVVNFIGIISDNVVIDGLKVDITNVNAGFGASVITYAPKSTNNKIVEFKNNIFEAKNYFNSYAFTLVNRDDLDKAYIENTKLIIKDNYIIDFDSHTSYINSEEEYAINEVPKVNFIFEGNKIYNNYYENNISLSELFISQIENFTFINNELYGVELKLTKPSKKITISENKWYNKKSSTAVQRIDFIKFDIIANATAPREINITDNTFTFDLQNVSSTSYLVRTAFTSSVNLSLDYSYIKNNTVEKINQGTSNIIDNDTGTELTIENNKQY
jgi:hypothetical protein